EAARHEEPARRRVTNRAWSANRDPLGLSPRGIVERRLLPAPRILAGVHDLARPADEVFVKDPGPIDRKERDGGIDRCAPRLPGVDDGFSLAVALQQKPSLVADLRHRGFLPVSSTERG